MHRLLRVLSRQRRSTATGLVITSTLLLLATLLRLVAPLDAAPFLLYMPLVFLGSLAFGWISGAASVVISDALAALFFIHDTGGLQLGEVIALVQYAVVGAFMVAICNALRQAIIDTETALEALVSSQSSLQLAKQEAEASKEAAEAANRAKSAFLANMSHELRTPLSAVIGYSEMLEEDAEEMNEPGLLTDLGKIKSNAKHLLSLINDVLDLSKVEANKMDVVAERIELAGFVRDVAATVDTLLHQKNNALVLDMEADPGTMDTDAVKLRQCLLNLLSNAAKFTEGGTVTLRVRRGDGVVRFAVQDTGIGMSEEQLRRLFLRFSQADESTTRKYGGTGLGLALSRAFAQLLGGDITVESEPGVGTCFTLLIPATLQRPQPVEPVAPAAPGSDLVLVIDDEAAQRELTTRFLNRQGFAVRTAADGVTGLALAQELHPCAILLDVMMPGMDGWSVLKALKAAPDTASIPVIMVSLVAEAALGRELGAAGSIPKPVDWAHMKTVMQPLHSPDTTVLVVDDDPDMRLRLRAVLEPDGWHVMEAENGAAALASVARHRPELIVLDLTMPVMDGFSFLHRLRTLPDCADLPVVVLSARDISAAERGELAEADRILSKGETSLSDLRAEIRQLAPGTAPGEAAGARLSPAGTPAPKGSAPRYRS